MTCEELVSSYPFRSAWSSRDTVALRPERMGADESLDNASSFLMRLEYLPVENCQCCMDTQITFVLDESGSMSKIKEDTIGGFNEFLADQRDEEGTASVSLITFDTTVSSTYDVRPIEQAAELNADTYAPGGRTALYDALVTAISETASHIEQMAAATRPETVIVVALTDGKENASETTQEQVRDRVKEHQEEGWEFLFIGANQDAALTAGQMGIDADQSLDMAHTGEGTRAAYESTSQQISQARQEGEMDGYDDADRKRQTDAE